MSERVKIQIQSFTEVKTAASKRQYFTLQDMAQAKFVCFIPELRDHCHIGETIDAEIELGKTPSDTPRLVNIWVDGKLVYEEKKKAPFTRQGRSDESYAIERRSIERQTSAKLAFELYSKEEGIDALNFEYVLKKAEQIYQWISGGKDEIKISGEGPIKIEFKKDKTGEKIHPIPEPTVVGTVCQEEAGQPPVVTDDLTKEKLFEWVKEKMKWKTTTAVGSFLVNKCKISNERIEQDPEGCKTEISALMGW